MASNVHLLPFEQMLVELLLQALIGQVDTQLLEAVLLEALKAIDVQDANGTIRALPRTCKVCNAASAELQE